MRLVFISLLFLLVVGIVGTVASETSIRITAFNVLAPSWAAPSSYAPEITPLLRPWQTRLNKTMNYVVNNMLDADFLTFQETEVTINSYISERLGMKYEYISVFHDDSYWGSYIRVDPPFARNGVSIAVNKEKYDQCVYTDLALETGNHCIIATCRNKLLNRWIRVASVHFDSDTGGNRGKESKNLVKYLDGEHNLTIISGDFNADTDQGVIKQRVTDAGFEDVFKTLGNNNRTHPFSKSYYGNDIYGKLDHIVVRGQSYTPTNCKVHDNDLFVLFPNTQQLAEPNETPRVFANMQLVGSDHFPIEATLLVSN